MGHDVRTNSESFIGFTALDRQSVFSDGIAIGSILDLDDVSHVEPVRHPAGSGFFRLIAIPQVRGRNMVVRLAKIAAYTLRHPARASKVVFVDDWAKRTQALMLMQALDSRLRLARGRLGLMTQAEAGEPPTGFLPQALDLARRYSPLVGGEPVVFLQEALFGIPTTAHILGGAVMGRDAGEGVIDAQNRVFGYANMYVCDGSMVSANLGVNPALTILALTERAMARIPRAMA